ncbi:hypothetical protein U0070_026213 [Myodes glareolus]|uniref:Uncharacterized protein n=1 Tax=Myodes glareolus TaxID=447135 RepID=A0AAW0J1E8_MYOGA
MGFENYGSTNHCAEGLVWVLSEEAEKSSYKVLKEQGEGPQQARLQRHISWETRGNQDTKRMYQGRSLAYSHYVVGVEKYEMRLLQ